MKKWFEKYDVFTKAVAVLIAIILWVYVVSVVDPMDERTIDDIMPTYIGSEELLNAENLVVGNKDENLVDIKLSGTRRELAAIDETGIKVEVDLSKTREAGTYELAYKVVLPSNDVSVVNRNPNRLTVRLDKIVNASVPVKLKFEGNVAEGYILGKESITPSALSVIGSAEDVAKVAYAQVIIGKKDLNTSINQTMEFTFYDAEDNAIEAGSIQAQETVEVSLPVLKTKTLPLAVDLVEGGGAKEKNVSYAVTPEVITVAGDEKTIDALDELTIGVIDLSKYSKNTTLNFKLTMPDGIQNVSGEPSADVKVDFSGLTLKTLEVNAIEVINVPDGSNISVLTNSLQVVVRGNDEDLKRVLAKDVRIVVDLAGTVLNRGQHTLDGYAVVDGIDSVGAVGEYKVLVKVSK